jgi:predicted hydrolase (HD superfamily)
MPVALTNSDALIRDYIQIVVVMAYYLNNMGLNKENYSIVRIMKNFLYKIPEPQRRPLVETLKLDAHLQFNYNK